MDLSRTPLVHVLFLLFALCGPSGSAAWASAGATLASIQPPATIKLCFDDTPLPPWRTRHQEGLYFELLNRSARTVGIRLAFSPMPWTHCMAQVAEGRMDGAFAVAFSAERQRFFVFPPGAGGTSHAALRTDAVLLVQRRGGSVRVSTAGISGLNTPLGIPADYAAAEKLRARGIAIDQQSTEPLQLLTRVLTGELAAAAIDAGKWRQLQTTGGSGLDQLVAEDTPLMTQHYYLALSRQLVARSPDLARNFWEAVERHRHEAAYLERERAALMGPGSRH